MQLCRWSVAPCAAAAAGARVSHQRERHGKREPDEQAKIYS